MKPNFVVVANLPEWNKINDELCSIIKFTIHSSWMHILHAHETCGIIGECHKVCMGFAKTS